MASPERDLLEKALSLPPAERAQLAHELIVSLDEGEDSDSADAWVRELERRARDVTTGAVDAEEWASVRERCAARWRKR
jgi:putative addiction module component (TIGR02574 family)